MNNKTVFFLAQSGMLNVVAHTLDVAHAYKVVKFRNVMKALVEKAQKQESDLFAEAGIESPETYNEQLKALEGNETEWKALAEKGARFRALQNELMAEEVDTSDIKAMPYDEWYKLCQENKDIITAEVEDALLGVLWKEPEE